MYVISRNIRGTKEVLKDSSRNSNKTFSNFSSAETFVKRINFYTHSDQQWQVKKINTMDM